MSKSRQIQVTTLTNLALTTWIFFSSGIKNMFCCGIIKHPWNAQRQLAHLHTVGSQQSSFRNISDLVTKARKCSDLSLIKKNVRHTFVVFFSVQDLELVIRIKVKTLYLIPRGTIINVHCSRNWQRGYLLSCHQSQLKSSVMIYIGVEYLTKGFLFKCGSQ